MEALDFSMQKSVFRICPCNQTMSPRIEYFQPNYLLEKGDSELRYSDRKYQASQKTESSLFWVEQRSGGKKRREINLERQTGN